MKVKTLKRILSDLLSVGRERIKVDLSKPENVEEVENAASRKDAVSLMEKGIVKIERKKGRAKKERRKRKGPGSRKGKKYSRKDKKEIWMERIRAQRKLLKELVESGKLDKSYKKEIYRLIKGGHFKGRKSMLSYLEEKGYLR